MSLPYWGRMNSAAHDDGTLVITRHGESEWNVLGKWTGWTDVGLTPKGVQDAERVGALLRDIDFDAVYTSALIRTHQTLEAIMRGKGVDCPSYQASEALNERDYGVYTGMNKWELQKSVSPEEFAGLRRGWDYPVKGGENLKQVYERVIPYFQSEILPRLQRGENVLVVAHGNSDRALIKYLDAISDDDIADVEMAFGSVLIYRFHRGETRPFDKQYRQADIEPTHA